MHRYTHKKQNRGMAALVAAIPLTHMRIGWR